MTEIMQGDSYPIYIDLYQDGSLLKPYMIEDLEVYVGENLRKTFLNGTVLFDEAASRWYIRPTQEETFDFEEGVHDVVVRVKYKGETEFDVVGKRVDRIKVKTGVSREVL